MSENTNACCLKENSNVIHVVDVKNPGLSSQMMMLVVDLMRGTRRNSRKGVYPFISPVELDVWQYFFSFPGAYTHLQPE